MWGINALADGANLPDIRWFSRVFSAVFNHGIMTTEQAVLAKSDLRRVMRQRRAQMRNEEREAASQAICARLSSLLCSSSSANQVAQHDVVAVYLATKLEASVDDFARELLGRGVSVGAPVGEENDVAFRALHSFETVREGAFGVREPIAIAGENVLRPDEISIFVVPGLAFSLDGARLGQGGGWYDRALAQAQEEEEENSQALVIGACFDCQLVETLPRESHDQNVGLVVTEKRIVRAKRIAPND